MTSSALFVTPLPAFTDNYIWLAQRGNSCFVVDPGDASVVEEYLAKHPKLQLEAIIITHHHFDHTGGVSQLIRNFPQIKVFGPKHEKIEGISDSLEQPDICSVLGCEFDILDVPGHTMGHISYYCKQEKLLFCGDTLFVAGCGRLFEGTPAQMLNSLQKFASLPEDTQVFCTHEYTLANLKFARTLEPDNSFLFDFERKCFEQRKLNIPTVPSSIGNEKRINPFLRTHRKEVQETMQAKLGQKLTGIEVFAQVRSWKDNF